jgi:multidrug transporter EmrE-like cation transporter
MTWFQLALILITVTALAAGQVLFKLAATSLDFSSGWQLAQLFEPRLAVALVVYAGATLLWLAVLRITPLRLAYPFVGLAFVLVPVLGYYILGEPLSGKTFVGAGLILLGIWISVA